MKKDWNDGQVQDMYRGRVGIVERDLDSTEIFLVGLCS